MVGITSTTGLGSGLDISGIVSQLVEAEIQPQANRLNRQEARIQAELSAVGTLKGAMSGFQGALTGLKGNLNFSGYNAVSSDAAIADVTVKDGAVTGNFDLSVTNLATAHSLVTDTALTGAQFTSENSIVGTGTLTFKFGTTTYDPVADTYGGFVQNPEKGTQSITITDGTLKGVRDAINAAGMGVNAAIINDGTHFRLALSSKDGAASSMEITVADDDGNNSDPSGLSLLSFNATANHMAQTGAGQDAQLTLNGIALTSASNVLTSAVSGLDITLKSAGNTSLSVTRDNATARGSINAFVESYNTLNKTMNDLSAYDPDTKRSGALQGDVTLLSIRSRLNAIIGNPVAGLSTDAPYRVLADIGITRSSIDGAMVIDSTKLDAALTDHPQAVASLFGEVGVTTDNQIDYVSAEPETQVGTSAINITSLATQGQYSGSAATNLTITAGINDAIDLTIDGVSGGIVLTPNTYTADSIAAELQSRINGLAAFSDAGISVVASQTAGVLTLLSKSYGTTSKIDVTGGNGKSGLFGAAPVATTWGDVAGNIGAYPGTGTGQELTGDAGALGLKVAVSGGATGSRGSVTFTRGIAYGLNALMDSMLDSDGTLTDRTNSLNDRVDDLGVQRESLAHRQSALQARLQKQFIALDSLVGQLRATSNALASQLASINQVSNQ